MTLKLHTATINLLKETKLEDWKKLADECDTTVAWIRQLLDGSIKEPGVNKIEKLFNALGGDLSKL